GIAIDHHIARAPRQIPAVGHAVVHAQLLKTVSAPAIDAETFRLCVIGLNRHLHAYDIKTLEYAIVRGHVKCRDAEIHRSHAGKIENRQFAGVSDITDAAFGDVVDNDPRVVGGGDVRVAEKIASA